MAYPSTLSTYTDPTPSDKLSTTPHSSIESAQNTGIKELQAFVGTLSSVAGTLMYDIRGAGSNGGGHVQTANKGGTGQTAYTKGDILVATSSSVLTKLAVSSADNDFLTVDSSVAAGVKWQAGVTSGQVQNMAFSNATDGGTGSVYSISPVPCVLSYAEGQVFTFRAANANTVTIPAINVSSLASKSIKNPDGTALNIGQIAASAMTMIQYQGHTSVFHLLSQKNGSAITTFGSGVATRAGNAANGSQTIAHGLGVTPKYVRITIYWIPNTAGSTGQMSHSTGVYNGTAVSAIYMAANTNSQLKIGNSTSSIATIYQDDNDAQVATISTDATNITLAWTLEGTMTGVNMQILWEAYA